MAPDMPGYLTRVISLFRVYTSDPRAVPARISRVRGPVGILHFTTSPLFPLAPCRRSASDPRSGRPRRKPRNVPRDSREDGLGVIPASKLVLWPCRTALHLSQIGECSTARASRQKDAKGKRKGSHLVMGKTYTLCSETILPRAYDRGWTGERKKTYSSRPNPLPL